MKMEFIQNPLPDFDWVKYERGDHGYTKEEFERIKDEYENNPPLSGGKDIRSGEIVKLTSLVSVNENTVVFSNGMIDIPIELEKEKRFLDIHGTNKEGFVMWLSNDNGKEFLSENQFAEIEDVNNFRASLLKGFGKKIKDEFFQQIKKPTTAYTAKVISKNRGGYIIDIMGVRGFLPGSLAAANIVKNFDDFVGSNVNVMVEDYLSNINTFVFSNKKYISYIIPQKVKELDLEKEYEGTITANPAKFGIFIEIDEIFTGLLHVTKMSKDTFSKFKNGEFGKNDKIKIYIKEIAKDNKLVLTTFTPDEQKAHDIKMKKERSKKMLSNVEFKHNEIYTAIVTGVKMFGSFLSVTRPNGGRKINGLVVNDTQFEKGSKQKVKFVSRDGNKFYFAFA